MSDDDKASPDKGWIPPDWRKRFTVGLVALVGAVIVAAVGVFLPRILDAAAEGPHQATDVSAPFETKIMTEGRAPTNAYAMSADSLDSDVRANALITSGKRPDGIIPIDERRDSWVLRGRGSDPVTIVDITAVAVTVAPLEDEVYIEYGQGGQGGGDEEPSEVYSFGVDLTSGDAMTSTGESFFESKAIVLRDDRSTFLHLSFSAPEAKLYTWVLHFDVQTQAGELIDIYAGPSGELHTDKTAIPATDVFTLAGRAPSYPTAYLPGEDGRPQLATEPLEFAASSADPTGVPPELAGRWCPRAGTADCFDTANLMRTYPAATFSRSAASSTGSVSYSVCLNGPGDCVTASMMYLEYFPSGVAWDCDAVGNSAWDGCDPDYTSDHDTSEVRLVIRPNHQQGEHFVDTPPLYRNGS